MRLALHGSSTWKLYYSAGRCSMGIRILLEEIGEPFDAVALDVFGGESRRPPFIDLNPKGKCQHCSATMG